MNYKVSVIIPVYKVESYIERCARSLLNQSLSDIEYIFVNDCSPDNSIVILNKVLQEMPDRSIHVRILSHDKNEGVITARNTGLSNAKGDYIIFCDSDDWVESTMIEKMYKTAIYENADIVGCDFVEEYAVKKHYRKMNFDLPPQDLFMHLLKGDKTMHGGLWIRLVARKIYENKIFCPKGLFPEDLVMSLQLHYYSKKVVYIPEALYHYAIIPTSITNTVSSKKMSMQVEAGEFIKAFLVEHNLYEQYYMALMERLFSLKKGFVFFKNVRDYKKWRILWPDSNRYIWRYDIPLYYKCIYGLAECHLYKLLETMIFIKEVIKRKLKK